MTDKTAGKKKVLNVSPEEKAILAAFNKRIKELSKPNADDFRLRCEADLSARYSALLNEVKSYSGRFDIAIANKIHAAIFKSVPKLPRKLNARVVLADNSIGIAGEVLAEVVRRSHRYVKDQRASESLIRRTTDTLLGFARARDDAAGWVSLAAFLQSATSEVNLRFDHFVSEDSLGPVFHALRDGVTTSLRKLLEVGDANGARQILGVCSRHSELDESCRHMLHALFAERAATLPRESQQLAIRTLGVPNAGQVEYANPAESPEVRQAAALLLYLFDLRGSGPEFREAFERYVAVAGNQFSLFLRGHDSTMPYDARLHEPPESGVPERPVKVIRPWVEWYRPPDARVVIRGIVE